MRPRALVVTGPLAFDEFTQRPHLWNQDRNFRSRGTKECVRWAVRRKKVPNAKFRSSDSQDKGSKGGIRRSFYFHPK